MPKTDLETLVVSLEARTKAYENALARAHNTTVGRMKAIERTIDASAARTESRFATMGRTITRSLGAIGVGLSFASVSRGLASSLTELANLSEAADEAGTSVERLQAIVSAGVEFGIDQEQLVKGIARFNLQLGDAINGGNELGDILAANNIPIKDANGEFRDTVDVLLDVANLIQNAGSAQERMVIATAALSREGRKWIPLLIGGREQMEGALATAVELGNVIGSDVVEATDRFVDAWDKFVLRAKNFIKADLGELIIGLEAVGAFGETELKQRRDLVLLERERAEIINQIVALEQEILLAPPGDHFAGLNEERLRKLRDELGTIVDEIDRIGGAIDKVNQKTIAPKTPTVLPSATSAPTTIGGVGTHTVPGAGGTVPVRVTHPLALDNGALAAGVAVGVREGVIDLRTGLVQSVDGVGTGVRDLRTGLVGAIDDVSGHVDSSGDDVVSAIGYQTTALSSSFGEVARHLTEGISSLISGPGSGQTFTSTAASPNFVAGLFEKELIANLEKQIEARQAEIAVLQTGLQYKTLTTEQTKEARLQIAALSLEIAQFSQGITTASQGIAQGTGFFADATTLFGDVLSQQIARAKQAGAALGSSLTAAEAARLSKINSFGGFAEGGVVRGPGGPKSDMVPIMASAGEFVVNAKQARKYRELLEAINAGSGRFMADGGLVARANASAQRLASGGVVQAVPAANIGSRDINIQMTVVAQDAQSFRGSHRDMIRQMKREIMSADI